MTKGWMKRGNQIPRGGATGQIAAGPAHTVGQWPRPWVCGPSKKRDLLDSSRVYHDCPVLTRAPDDVSIGGRSEHRRGQWRLTVPSMTSAQHNRQVTIFCPRHTGFRSAQDPQYNLTALVGRSRATDKLNAVGSGGPLPRHLLHMIQNHVILDRSMRYDYSS
jgi:hypothetical protein